MSGKLPISDLKNDLAFVIQDQIKNSRLLQFINKEFANKGFERSIPTMLFNEEMDIDNLEDKELLAVSKCCYEFLNANNIEIKNININPADYFEGSIFAEYELQTTQKEKRNPVVVFDECRRIDANNYWVYLTAEQHLQLRKNRNVQYFKSIQRMAKIVTLPNGLKVKKINTNPEGIKKMKARLKDKETPTLRPTSIAFALLQFENKSPKVNFMAEYKNTGKLRIETNFDINSENYAPLIIPDGYHRWTSYCDAYADDPTVTEGLGVHIHFMTVPEAKQYVSDVFERNETDEEYKETMKDTSAGRFIEAIISNSNILRGNVANTITEYKELDNTLTYLGVLNECAKYTRVDLKNDITSEREARKIAKIIDMMLNYIVAQYFENDINNMKNTFLLAPNTFVGYIAIANALKDNTDNKILSGDIADKLVGIKENLINTLKLDIKDCDVEKIYKYFESVAKEVL